MVNEISVIGPEPFMCVYLLFACILSIDADEGRNPGNSRVRGKQGKVVFLLTISSGNCFSCLALYLTLCYDWYRTPPWCSFSATRPRSFLSTTTAGSTTFRRLWPSTSGQSWWLTCFFNLPTARIFFLLDLNEFWQLKIKGLKLKAGQGTKLKFIKENLVIFSHS